MNKKDPLARSADSTDKDSKLFGGSCPRCEKGIEVWDEETVGVCITCRKQKYRDDNSS